MGTLLTAFQAMRHSASERARDMGVQARYAACQLTWARVVQAVEAEYQRAVDENSAMNGRPWRPALTVG